GAEAAHARRGARAGWTPPGHGHTRDTPRERGARRHVRLRRRERGSVRRAHVEGPRRGDRTRRLGQNQMAWPNEGRAASKYGNRRCRTAAAPHHRASVGDRDRSQLLSITLGIWGWRASRGGSECAITLGAGAGGV